MLYAGKRLTELDDEELQTATAFKRKWNATC